MSDAMTFYTCRVRLGGDRNNDVEKLGVPAPEVILLQVIHGEDAVFDLRKATKSTPKPELMPVDFEKAGANPREGWSDRVTREYLRRIYGEFQDGRDKVNTVFGSSFTPLPKAIALAEAPAKADVEAIEAGLEQQLREKLQRENEAVIEAEVAKRLAQQKADAVKAALR